MYPFVLMHCLLYLLALLGILAASTDWTFNNSAKIWSAAIGREDVTGDVVEGGPPRKSLNGRSEVPGSSMLALVVALLVAIHFDSRNY
jgi:hypothetical protein